ncbi:MAG: GerMN domain-containing protein [Dehalobacterium sp.]
MKRLQSRDNVIKSTKVLFLFLFLLLFVLSGCLWSKDKPAEGNNPDSTKNEANSEERKALLVKDQELVVVYFAASDGKNIVPVTLAIKPSNEAAKIAVEKLLAGPENDFSQPTICEGTKLKDLYLQGATAYVDLTEEVLSTSEDSAEQTIEALVFTLTEFPTVQDVQILINGQIKEKLGLVDISKPIARPEAINYYGDKPSDQNIAKIYFSDSNAVYLVPVTMQVDAKNPPLSALKKLVKGPPKESGLVLTIWQGTKINDFKVEDYVATVDFSTEVLGYGGGSTAEMMLINSVLYTLTQFPEIERVQFLIDGNKIEFFPEGSDVSSPLMAPSKINFTN